MPQFQPLLDLLLKLLLQGFLVLVRVLELRLTVKDLTRSVPLIVLVSVVITALNEGIMPMNAPNLQ